MAADSSKPPALPAGSLVSDYRLRERLHEDCHGITYLADHLTEDLRVALLELVPADLVIRTQEGDVIPRSVAREADFIWAKQRFIEEAQILASCQHENVVKVLELFETCGTTYMAMSHEPGASLETWLMRLGRPPSEKEVRAIIGPILRGLEAAHASGLAHLGINPETISICEDRDRPVLIGFAAARMAICARSQAKARPLNGRYDAPELYEGGNSGPLCDIYSFGATVHRIISGNAPPDPKKRVTSGTCHPLAFTHADSYSVALLQVVDACLHLKPADRPATAAVVLGLINNAGGPPATILPKGKQLPEKAISDAVPPTFQAALSPAPAKRNVQLLVGGLLIFALLLAAFMYRNKGGDSHAAENQQAELLSLKRKLAEEEQTHRKEVEHLRDLASANSKSIVSIQEQAPSQRPTSSNPDTVSPASRAPVVIPADVSAVPPPLSEKLIDPAFDKVARLARQYYEMGSSVSGRRERISMYAGRVFYIDTYLDPEGISRSDDKYAMHWPRQSYVANPASISRTGGGYEANVSFAFKAMNDVETSQGQRAGKLHFNDSLKIDSVESTSLASDTYSIDPLAQKAALLAFIDFYFQAGRSNADKRYQQIDFFAPSVYPYFDDTKGRAAFNRVQVANDLHTYLTKNTILDLSRTGEWVAVSGLGTKTVILEGSITIEKLDKTGRSQSLTLQNRIGIHMNMQNASGGYPAFRMGPLSMEIFGIAKPQDW